MIILSANLAKPFEKGVFYVGVFGHNTNNNYKIRMFDLFRLIGELS